MRKDVTSITERDLMFVIGGQLYSQAPNRQPRKVEIIMQKIRDRFRGFETTVNSNEWYYHILEKEKIHEFIHDLLFSIPEFLELNLSQIEYENNIDVNDKNRPAYAVTTRYDKYDKESWKKDFIDLDAFVGNVERNLFMIMSMNEDCFLCIHQPENTNSTLSPGNSKKCNECTINPTHQNNYEGRRYPKGKYTFACKYDCFHGHYICCEECDKKESCTFKCDSKSDTCGLSINHINQKTGSPT